MIFEWDEQKNQLNIHKHGVSFDQAKEIFALKTTVFIGDEVIDHEMRWKAIGTMNGYRYIMVVHTYHSDDGEEYIRIISARKLGKNEVTKWL